MSDHQCEPPMCGRTECFVYGCRECHDSDGTPVLPDHAPNGFCRSCGVNVYEQLKAVARNRRGQGMTDFFGVACPKCKEPKGHYCKQTRGLPSVKVHAARIKAASASEAGVKPE